MFDRYTLSALLFDIVPSVVTGVISCNITTYGSSTTLAGDTVAVILTLVCYRAIFDI